MSDPYERVKGGRLTFKGGTLATRATTKTIDKNNKKKKKKKNIINTTTTNDSLEIPDENTTTTTTVNIFEDDSAAAAVDGDGDGGGGGAEVAYTIDAARKMKYEQLFPVEAKKFRYDPINVDYNSKTVEDALDDRVKKKADRYCK